MNLWENFAIQSRDVGFDTFGVVLLEEARKALTIWRSRSLENAYAQNMITDPRMEMSKVQCLIVLGYPYQTIDTYAEGTGRVSAYYPASQAAYHASQTLADWLKSQGVQAQKSKQLPLKPMAEAAKIGDYGRNGLIVRKGTHIALQMILMDTLPEKITVHEPQEIGCLRCGACERACPTQALSGGKVDPMRCLRHYMDGNKIPSEIKIHMQDLLLGCDTCLNACPNKGHSQMPESWKDLFAWESLQDPSILAANRKALSDIVGANFYKRLHLVAKQHSL